MMSNKIWYLPGPFHQYREDVKALAKDAGLRIIDANVTADRGDEAENTPEVTLKEAEQHLVLVVGAGDNKVELEELIGKLRIEGDMLRAVIDGFEAGEIEKPECGELAIRLYQALEHIREKVDELATSRDALATDNEKLRGEIESLKAGEGQEVEALKARLDAAGIAYRTNASKETLERLVSELPEA